MSRASLDPEQGLSEDQLRGLRQGFQVLETAIGGRFLGHEEIVQLLLYAVLSDGHVLLEGAPGLGKTTLVRVLARSLELDFRRVQFTPDLMPADILGSRLLEIDEGGGRHFSFEKGPVFTDVLLVDEINRATPRTQSALLEAMQERQVTLFGETHPLGEPFLVIATQNPIEMEGTYPLPEAQLDRFQLKIEIAAPPLEELVKILAAGDAERQAAAPAVLTAEKLADMRALVRGVPASSEIVSLVARLIRATHPDAEGAPDEIRHYVRYGSSPRGGQSILAAARARALAHGRLCVNEEDVRALAVPALRHRLILGYEGEAAGVSPEDLIHAAWAAARK